MYSNSDLGAFFHGFNNSDRQILDAKTKKNHLSAMNNLIEPPPHFE